MTAAERRKALTDFIATARPVLCAWCGDRLLESNGHRCPRCVGPR